MYQLFDSLLSGLHQSNVGFIQISRQRNGWSINVQYQ